MESKEWKSVTVFVPAKKLQKLREEAKEVGLSLEKLVKKKEI